MSATCDTCEPAFIRTAAPPPHNVDVVGTINALASRVASGRMRYLRGDVPLMDMLDLARSELKFTIVSFMQCEDCGAVKFWGLCIRGAPIYKTVGAERPALYQWDPVPPRQSWARQP
ncbi:hypothetical protein E3T55_05840 [Cryobacterium frigoriphilum]|uniref:Uncharacterized protein n=1 Tax=Cryobacterium frigoriphilum TaxID=1259150 RepID=A0A4R9A688_9MICO|nr:hypothetical protein [Cryobacterium frigoriphilum]TFD52933.1 hypothetical protein E3T55_05840 [Cryobacterium frigoriphilum]